jgi:tRNA dimethylallyltransferase
MNRRAALEADVAEPSGLAAAYERLRALDPIAAARIEPGNARRIVRALEVIDATGQPFSSFGAGLDDYPSPSLDVALVGIWLPRTELARRIARRFSTMRDLGLEAEVRRVSGTPGGLSRTARQAIGYKEVLAFLDGELPSIDDAFELAVARTRKFARRQRVWFRRDPRIHWIGAARNPDDLAGVVLALWEPAGATLAPYPA